MKWGHEKVPSVGLQGDAAFALFEGFVRLLPIVGQ